MEQNLENIKAYLDGSLSDSELSDFKSQLASNPELKQEVAAYQTIFKGFQHLEQEDFEREVAKWGADLKEKNVVVGIRKAGVLYRRIALAASIILLLGFGMSWWGTKNYSNEALADKFYSAPISSQTMGDSTDELLKPFYKLFEKAHEQFQAGTYEKAIRTFNDLIAILESNPGKMDELSFKYYKENVEWTSVLAGLRMDQLDENLLSQIANNHNHGYTEQAQNLESDLNSILRKMRLKNS